MTEYARLAGEYAELAEHSRFVRCTFESMIGLSLRDAMGGWLVIGAMVLLCTGRLRTRTLRQRHRLSFRLTLVVAVAFAAMQYLQGFLTQVPTAVHSNAYAQCHLPPCHHPPRAHPKSNSDLLLHLPSLSRSAPALHSLLRRCIPRGGGTLSPTCGAGTPSSPLSWAQRCTGSARPRAAPCAYQSSSGSR